MLHNVMECFILKILTIHLVVIVVISLWLFFKNGYLLSAEIFFKHDQTWIPIYTLLGIVAVNFKPHKVVKRSHIIFLYFHFHM